LQNLSLGHQSEEFNKLHKLTHQHFYPGSPTCHQVHLRPYNLDGQTHCKT